MKIELSRILPDESLSQFRLRDMRPEESIVATCNTVAEFNNARQTAKIVKSSVTRADGYEYKIETSSTENTVKVSLFKDGRE